MGDRSRGSAARALAELTHARREEILRRWRQLLRAYGLRPTRGAARAELGQLLDELGEAAVERPEDVARSFAARARAVGLHRRREGGSLRDAAHELAALQQALIATWGRRQELLPASVVTLLSEVFVETLSTIAVEWRPPSRVEGEARPDRSLSRALLQGLQEGVLVLDAEGEGTASSRSLRALLGVEQAGLLGRAAAQTLRSQVVTRGDTPGRPAGLRALDLSEPIGPERVVLRHARTGEERMVEVRALPLLDEQGLEGAVQLFVDHTELERLRGELDRSDRELGVARARVLRHVQDWTLGDLTAGAALALNNELNALTLANRLVREEIAILAPKANRHLDSIERAIQRSAVLLRRLQQLSARGGREAPRALDLNQEVTAALDLVRPELSGAGKGRGVSVDARLGAPPPVLATGSQLREILCTLLVEARDAVAEGPLRISTGPTPEGGNVFISYASEIDDVRTLFSTETDSGLTLDGAREIARRLGGSLHADLRDGRVSFRLELPTAPEERPSPAPARPGPRAGPLKVLVVDDDEGNRETLAELLVLSGHSVDMAASRQEASASAQRRPYDVALVDLAMPGTSGIEIAHELKETQPTLRVALVTGWDLEAPPPEAAQDIEAVLRKPIDLARLRAFLLGPPEPGAAPEPPGPAAP